MPRYMLDTNNVLWREGVVMADQIEAMDMAYILEDGTSGTDPATRLAELRPATSSLNSEMDEHLGMTPQSVNAFGGNRVQGRTEDAAQTLLEDAKAVERAGAFAVVLECIPADLAARITRELTIPTIGIGAGDACDGQILVYMDMLGMFSDYTPKFVKHFAELGKEMKEAFAAYDREVKAGAFPDAAHAFGKPAKA